MLGKEIRKYQRYKQEGIRDEESQSEQSQGYESEGSDMAIDTSLKRDKNGNLRNKGAGEIAIGGVMLTFDKEVLEILNERVNIRNMETDIKHKQEDELESIDDMYSDLDDEPLPTTSNPVTNPGSNDLSDLIADISGGAYNQTISDLVKSIEMKREREKEAKKQRDIKPATVEDYFTGFSSTVTKKVVNPKKIRSVMEEAIATGKMMTEEDEQAEIQRRIVANSDDYMEWFPVAQDATIQAFDEKDFAKKVKEKFYDEDVIKKDEEWMKAERKVYDGRHGQKYTQDDLRKREAKDKRKLNKETEQVVNYLNNKQG